MDPRMPHDVSGQGRHVRDLLQAAHQQQPFQQMPRLAGLLQSAGSIPVSLNTFPSSAASFQFPSGSRHVNQSVHLANHSSSGQGHLQQQPMVVRYPLYYTTLPPGEITSSAGGSAFVPHVSVSSSHEGHHGRRGGLISSGMGPGMAQNEVHRSEMNMHANHTDAIHPVRSLQKFHSDVGPSRRTHPHLFNSQHALPSAPVNSGASYLGTAPASRGSTDRLHSNHGASGRTESHQMLRNVMPHFSAILAAADHPQRQIPGSTRPLQLFRHSRSPPTSAMTSSREVGRPPAPPPGVVSSSERVLTPPRQRKQVIPSAFSFDERTRPSEEPGAGLVSKVEPITPKLPTPLPIETRSNGETEQPRPPVSNQRYKTIRNFPKYKHRKNSGFERRLKRNGLVLDPKVTVRMMRKLLQEYVNRDMDAVLESYMKNYFLVSVKNIRSNLGEDAFLDSDIDKLRGRIVKRVYKRYMCVDDDSDTSSADEDQDQGQDNVSDTMSECSSLSTDRRIRKNPVRTESPFSAYRNNALESDQESGYSGVVPGVGRTKKRKYASSRNSTNASGRSTPQKSVSPAGAPPNPKKRALNSTLHSQSKVDVSKFDSTTQFSLGSSANIWLGLGAARGRIYSKHPALFRYHCDAADKAWLVEAGHMTSHGVKAFMMLSEEVRRLGETPQYANLVGRESRLDTFTLPDWLIDKVKSECSPDESQSLVRPLVEYKELDGAVVQEKDSSPDHSPGIPFSSPHQSYAPMTALPADGCFFTNDQVDFGMSSPPMHEVELSPSGDASVDDDDDDGDLNLCMTGSFMTLRPMAQTSPQPPQLDRFDNSPYNSEFEELT